jgi:hypothetical protein
VAVVVVRSLDRSCPCRVVGEHEMMGAWYDDCVLLVSGLVSYPVLRPRTGLDTIMGMEVMAGSCNMWRWVRVIR